MAQSQRELFFTSRALKKTSMTYFEDVSCCIFFFSLCAVQLGSPLQEEMLVILRDFLADPGSEKASLL